MNLVQLSLKYIVDFFIAAVLFIPALLVSFAIGILIKSDSSGPVIFKQKRLGRNNREFILYKFRTMYQDAPQKRNGLTAQNEANGFLFKMAQDPRETKFGHFLRSTGLDELPQLINVLKGEMSLIGPRPLPVSDIDFNQLKKNEELSKLWQKRSSIKPGMTGWWQIYPKAKHSFQEMLKLDLEYIDKYSIFFDLKIIYLTIKYTLSNIWSRIKPRKKQIENRAITKEQVKKI